MKFARFLESKLVCGEISINGLSKNLDVTRRAVYRWISGEAVPEPAQLISLKNKMQFEPGEVGEMFSAWLNDKNLSSVIQIYIEEQLLKPLK